MLGYGMPSSGEISAVIPQKIAENIIITNETYLPFVIGENASNCAVKTKGKIKSNKGTDITILN